jgi:hypothetical protein
MGSNIRNSGNSGKNSSILNNAVSAVNSAANSAVNVASNTFSMKSSSNTTFLAVGGICIVILLAIFWKQINDGFHVMYEQFRQFFGAAKAPIQVPSDEKPEQEVVKDPVPPQVENHHEKAMVEKVLPGNQQVFNISKNSYTYYDAEPLCKALGAELATYEQVKEAYAKGADWCNYGWVKGQMAVYPTQTNTWEQLQQGPEDQRDACGRPGVNGGHFDNPELQFGVSCYGIKPQQSNHDATEITSGQGAPLSPSGLEFEKKVNKYRGEANHIAILPFNKSSWSS